MEADRLVPVVRAEVTASRVAVVWRRLSLVSPLACYPQGAVVATPLTPELVFREKVATA